MRHKTYPVVAGSVPGRFFVDESCIYCELCVETAPRNFAYQSASGCAFVLKQPSDPAELALVLEALEGCPIESIGDRENPKSNFM